MICNNLTIIVGNIKHSWFILLLLCPPCEAPMPIVSELQTLPIAMVECFLKQISCCRCACGKFPGSASSNHQNLQAERQTAFWVHAFLNQLQMSVYEEIKDWKRNRLKWSPLPNHQGLRSTMRWFLSLEWLTCSRAVEAGSQGNKKPRASWWGSNWPT